MSSSVLMLFLLGWITGCSAQSRLPVTVIKGSTDAGCPAREDLQESLDSTKESIQGVLVNLTGNLNCPCGGSGNWTRIAYLDMSDTTQQCPTNWQLKTPSSVRGCGRSSSAANTCDSVFYSSNGKTYSQVCGRMEAYQVGSPNAFNNSVTGSLNSINSPYLDGISLTHRTPSRQHIWSFAASYYEEDSSYNTNWNCFCTNTNYNWNYVTPSFVGNDYFCATGNPGPGGGNGVLYADDPLWDGEGCGPSNTCCQFNSPPWFCKTLPSPTSDSIELRNCGDQETTNEDVIVSLIEIYIK